MAILMAAPHLDIVSAQLGFSKITVTYSIIFDNNDRAVNQPYGDRIEMWGDDTNVGDPRRPVATTCSPASTSGRSVRA